MKTKDTNEKPERRKYRVFIAQVNQTYVEVYAHSEEEASEKAYASWRRNEGHSRVTYIEPQP